MKGLLASLAELLRELTYNERSIAFLQVDAALFLVGAGGHLENYGLRVRLDELAVEQVYFLEGLLPLEETPFFISVELTAVAPPIFIFISTPAPCRWSCSTLQPIAMRSPCAAEGL